MREWTFACAAIPNNSVFGVDFGFPDDTWLPDGESLKDEWEHDGQR